MFFELCLSAARVGLLNLHRFDKLSVGAKRACFEQRMPGARRPRLGEFAGPVPVRAFRAWKTLKFFAGGGPKTASAFALSGAVFKNRCCGVPVLAEAKF